MVRYLDKKNNRLVYFGVQTNREMWDQRWKAEDIASVLLIKKHDATDKMVMESTKKYLYPGCKILEGGCGLGRYVNLLNTLGYQVIGVDYAEKTIEAVRRLLPELDVRVADVQALPFDNDYFDGYWSFGVIEHFFDGYNSVGYEMKRVLKRGGYLFLTVPAFSRLRLLKASLGLFQDYHNSNPGKDLFYQYAYTSDDICGSFSSYGFDLIAQRGWGVFKGVTDELPATRLLMRILCRFFDQNLESLMGRFANHMHLFIFRKSY